MVCDSRFGLFTFQLFPGFTSKISFTQRWGGPLLKSHIWSSSDHAYFWWPSEQTVGSNTIILMKYVAWKRTKLSTQVRFFFLVLANELFIYVYNQTWWISSRIDKKVINFFYQMPDFYENCNHHSLYQTTTVGECLVDIWFVEAYRLTLFTFWKIFLSVWKMAVYCMLKLDWLASRYRDWHRVIDTMVNFSKFHFGQHSSLKQ